ncbi:short-chain dehydrogenase/reductase sdr [hydrocarbon metagenome]|uniref:3-dehydrosphinganine reductase n=1 Tax=hydrocarbon metagenome TaxID=938273 RepID=A0A0W8FKX6_9ZZZZ
MNYYKNKHVYITGGSSGIGLEIARKLFSFGANLTIIARNSAKLEDARRDIEKFKVFPGQFIRCLSVDVADNSELSRVVSQSIKEFGAPDILINSAGIISCDYLSNISYDTFDAIMKINLFGTRNIIVQALPAMKKGSHIVIISSMAGLVGMCGYTAYGTSKFALVGFAECLRGELKQKGIHLTLVCPPEIETPMLLEEMKTMPYESRILKNMAGQLNLQSVIIQILRSIARKKFMVVPGLRAKWLWLTQRFTPSLFRFSSDMITRWALSRKKSFLSR